jgi:hypothetical protein
MEIGLYPTPGIDNIRSTILVENIFRNLQSMSSVQQQMVEALRQGTYGRDPTASGSLCPGGRPRTPR